MIDSRSFRSARRVAGLVAATALLASPALVEAQSCLGTASFNARPVRLGGSIGTGDDVTTLGVDLAFGQPVGPFGSVGVALDDFDGLSESATTVRGSLGYQVPIGTAPRGRAGRGPQFCPIATVGYTLGPDFDEGAVDIETRTLAATAGFAVGAPIALSPGIDFVPTGGLALVYGRTTVSAGNSDRDASDSYGRLDLGVGLVFNDRFTVRPAVAIPLGLDGADSRFGLLFALNFGSR